MAANLVELHLSRFFISFQMLPVHLLAPRQLKLP